MKVNVKMIQSISSDTRNARGMRFAWLAIPPLVMLSLATSAAGVLGSGTANSLTIQQGTLQDARQLECQQKYQNNLGMCAGGPICWADNGICDYAPSDGTCEAQAQAKFERCLARPPRVRIN